MSNILITGATGNIGFEVIRFLTKIDSPNKIVAGVRDIEKAKGMIIVMILLHFLPRFQKEPKISGFYEQLTGKKPTDLLKFIERVKKAI